MAYVDLSADVIVLSLHIYSILKQNKRHYEYSINDSNVETHRESISDYVGTN